ncbi:uncharacterized protein LOC129266256 [Lytechinus pictus]|uniref:uncharacterized protein LOC129266256 n=1 Tax=Lytechinus pictus TaxID=7653 RepID=UPI0030B9C5F0
MSEKEDNVMEVDNKEEEEKEKPKDESGDDGEEEEEEEEETPKRRTPKTLTEKRLSRLSSGMEMRGMMTESYPCKECSASFSRKSKLDYHVANVHPKQPVIPIEEKSPARRGRKPKTPRKNEKAEKPEKAPKSLTPEVKKVGSGHQAEVQRAIQKQLLQQQQQHQLLQHQQMQQLQERQLQQQQQSQAIIFQNKQQSKLPKVTNISNEKVKYNWGYYCTACDMYFANMFAQQFHCLHGQAKFRCEACCICFKLRKNFMSHVQMVHGVDIPEEVLARMRPRSEIRAKQEADAEKNGQKKEESEPVDLTKDGSNSLNEKAAKSEVEPDKVNSDENGSSESKQPSSEKHAKENGENELVKNDANESGKSDANEIVKSDANETVKSDANETAKSDANETAKSDTNEHSTAEQAQDGEKKEKIVKAKDNTSEEPEIICISDSPAKKGKVLQLKAVTDVKQSESGGNSSADESDKKDEGRVYLTTVRMGNTYVTLPSGEKWMIECLRCHQAFFKMEDASVHMKQRPGSHFSCPHCHYSSTLYSQCDYEIHRLRTHSFPCAQCRQSFILECQRDMHEQKIHNYFRQLMRRKHPPGASGKTPPSGAQVKSIAGTNSGNSTRTIVVQSEGGTSSSKGVTKSALSRDGYPVVRTQRTPYVCLMCDRDCYTRDALEHHKKTFHSAVYRPTGKITHPISKSSIAYKTNRYPTGSINRNAPVSKILQEMRQGSDLKSANRTIAVAALQDPYLEPNKIPHAYISRIKVDLPDANKLVDTIRNELLKGPTNFSMPNYAKPSKFNKDMVTNPAVVKLSREVAYKLYFDLQGPCNESDKMNYKEPEKVLYKIPMGCHSHKLKDVPLFPTLEDLIFRTNNYTVPPLNTIAPVELFTGFQGELSMKDSVSFSQELDNCMFGCFTKTMRALTMIYSSRRVAVSEGFWRLQTKALIAILKEVEEQRKKEIGERAKAASVAAKAAAAAAASARPLKLKDYPQTVNPGSHVLLPNGGTLEQTSEGQPMIQLIGNKVPGTSDESVPDVVVVSADSKERSLPSPVSTNASGISDQSKAESSKASSTSVGKPEIPTLQSLAKRAADDKDGKQDEGEESKEEEEEMKEEEKEKPTDGETKKDEGNGEEDDEPKKKKRKTENGDDDDKKEVLVNGSASPPPGEGNGPAMNGMQNGPTEGGNPPNSTSSSESKVSQISVTDASQKGSKLSSTEGTTTAPTEPANNLTNGTLHAQLTGGTFQLPTNGTTFQAHLNGGSIHTPLNGGTFQTPLNGGTLNAQLSGGATPVVGGNKLFNLNLSSGQLSLLNGIPVQIKAAGNLGGNTLGKGVIRLGSGIGAGGAVGTVISGLNGVGNGFLGGGVQGGGGVLLSVPHSNVQLMPVPKLAYSVGAVSAVASVQNIPSLQVRQKPITLAVNNNSYAYPTLSKTIIHNPTTTFSPVNKAAATKPTIKPTITKLGNGFVPEKIAQFISQNFISIKPKQPGANNVPTKGEPLPTLLKVNNLAASVKTDPKVDELIKVCKLTSANGQSTAAAGNSMEEEFVLTRILESIAILKQLQTSKFLPEALCKKITPLCEKIVQASTTMEDKEDLSREVDSILKTEAKEAMKLFNQETDLNDNKSQQASAADGASQDARAIDQFLQSLAKRIKYIQFRLTARSIDPISMTEIVPLCQDICDPKLTLTKKVHVIKEIEDKIKAYETEARSQAATPVDIAAVPEEIEVDEDACVYFKLQLDDGSSAMVGMNDLEDAYQAISHLARLEVRVKRMNQNDVNREKRKLKRKKVEVDEDKAGKGEAASSATPKSSSSGSKKRKSLSGDAPSSKKKK